MLDLVIGEIPIHRDGPDWKASLRTTINSARQVILRHPWAPRVIKTRNRPGPSGLRYYDAVMGILREGGFSLEMTHHAIHLFGSRLLGFTQDLFDDSPDVSPDAMKAMAAALADSRVTSLRWRFGLGLAIVKSITEAHDGTLTLTSRPDGGLRATVELPTAPPNTGG
jgi:hypothetical protein